MKVNPAIFRGYDLRGLVDVDLSPEIAEHLGRAFGTYLKRNGITEAVVGRDSRATSPEYSEHLIKGLSWAGMDVVNIGMVLVGTFYWSQHYLKRAGGAYVSASHNPPEFNGFKFANGYSETMVSEGMKELCRMVQEEDYEQGDQPGAVREEDIREAYYSDIIKRLPVSRKLKVVVDPGCTTAGAWAPELFRRAGCEV
ncbi:MAG TPA: hypothetical protein VF809_02595, partial [Candidatus Saccharimonadales bacterium]